MKQHVLALTLSALVAMPLAQAETLSTPTKIVATQNASQVPSDASLLKLIEVTKVDKNFNEMIGNSQQTIDQIVKQLLDNQTPKPALTASQRQQLQVTISELAQQLIAAQNTPEFRQKLTNAYIKTAKETYTQAEVDAMLAFYGSPIGQSVVDKETAFGIAYMQAILPITMENQQKILQQVMPEFEQKIEKIVLPAKKYKQKTGKKL